jgi:hypothetical protein
MAFLKKYTVTSMESTSERGKANQIPLIPKKFGKIYNKGIKNNPWRLNVNNSAGNALPTA